MSRPNPGSYFDAEPNPRNPPTDPEDGPDTVATPEGDNEYPGDAPLTPSIVEDSLEGLQVPPGSKPRP
jgi:hypothetical protein